MSKDFSISCEIIDEDGRIEDMLKNMSNQQLKISMKILPFDKIEIAIANFYNTKGIMPNTIFVSDFYGILTNAKCFGLSIMSSPAIDKNQIVLAFIDTITINV